MGILNRFLPRRPVEKLSNLERLEPSGPVGLDEIARAKEYLRGRVGFDVEAFLAHRETVAIFDQPLGNSKSCLSVNEVADFVELAELNLIRRKHLAECLNCRVSIETYRRAVAEEWNPFASAITIHQPHNIRLPQGKDFFLILTNQAKEHVLAGLDPSSISVTGAIRAAGCRIDALDAQRYGATEAVALRFRDYSLDAPTKKGAPGRIVDWLTVNGKANGIDVHKQALVCVRVG